MLRVAETSYVKASQVACGMVRSASSVAVVDKRWLLLLSRKAVGGCYSCRGRAVAGCG